MRRTHATMTRNTRGAAEWPGRLLAAALRHPGAVLTGGLFAIALAAVSVNALTLQNAPHPAPLFGERSEQSLAAQGIPARERGTAALSDAPQNPAQDIATRQSQRNLDAAPEQGTALEAPPPPRAMQRPADTSRSIGDLLAAPVPPTRPDGNAATNAESSSRSTHDSIASLLADGDGPTRTGSTGAARADNLLAGAQRALDAMGYGPLTADGLYGPMTREAIERFESDHGLTVTGKLVPATAQALARESGIAFE